MSLANAITTTLRWWKFMEWKQRIYSHLIYKQQTQNKMNLPLIWRSLQTKQEQNHQIQTHIPYSFFFLCKQLSSHGILRRLESKWIYLLWIRLEGFSVVSKPNWWVLVPQSANEIAWHFTGGIRCRFWKSAPMRDPIQVRQYHIVLCRPTSATPPKLPRNDPRLLRGKNEYSKLL